MSEWQPIETFIFPAIKTKTYLNDEYRYMNRGKGLYPSGPLVKETVETTIIELQETGIVLIYDPRKGVHPGFADCGFDGIWRWWSLLEDENDRFQPTHWMPLPTPPKQALAYKGVGDG
jgi:hypothetical protein